MEQKRCMGCMELYDPGYGVCPHCGYLDGTPADEAVHMSPGTVLESRYVIGKVLGYGGFGATYIAWDPVLEQKVAIKEYLPSEFSTRMPGEATVTVFGGDRSEQFREGMEKFVEEAKRLSQFRSEPGIVKIFDSFQANSTAYIIMEYLDGETLTSYLDREGAVSEETAISMLRPVMQSLQAVHAEGLLHRDIAPDNIFITKDGDVKLIDFGASRYATTSHSRSLTVIIKPGYSPEEQYRSHGDQGPHTDVYSLAAVMYKMLTGVTPPDALERRAMIETKNKQILKDIHKLHKDVSPSVQNAVLNALNIQISDRTADVTTFLNELQSEKPVKRRYGKLKKIDLYSWPLWAKIVVPSVMIASLVTIGLLVTDVIHAPSSYSDEVLIPDGMVIVPEVEGMDKDEAIDEITKAGLVASADGNVSSAYVSVGKIVLQSPYGGNYLLKNGKVSLTVSSGTGVSDVVDGKATVPYVIWDSQSAAVSKLLAAGLGEPIIETAYDDNVAEGNVISQSVESGTTVDENTVITITVSLGAKPFAMPNVVNQTKDNAETLLNQKGLVVTFNYVEDSSVPENTVLGQDIPEGQSVKKGMTVQLKISSKQAAIIVTDVTGMLKDAASSTLKNQGFTVTVVENYDSAVEKGRVISQTPAGGTGQLPGTNITIVVSKGVQMVSVPNVVGKTESQATASLQNAGFTWIITKEYSTTVASGNVIRQTPESGSALEKGSSVTLCISTGAEVITVPNVVGQTKANAVSTLESAGFKVTLAQEHSSTVPAGNVIRQTPASGTSQEKGTSISLCVSLGVEMVTMPNVMDMTETNAVSALESAGLVVIISRIPTTLTNAGTVIKQSIEAYTQVEKGTEITLLITDYAVMPNVVGMTRENAISALDSAGFVYQNIIEEYSDTVPVGAVIRQTPASGTKHDSGTATIYVSLGMEMVTVPYVIGMTEAEAVSRMESAGFVVETYPVYTNVGILGIVIQQSVGYDEWNKVQEPKGTKISLGIITAVTVPNVVGMTEENAKAALENLSVTCKYKYSDSIPTGTVISQSIAANQQVEWGTEITLIISEGLHDAHCPFNYDTNAPDWCDERGEPLCSRAGSFAGYVCPFGHDIYSHAYLSENRICVYEFCDGGCGLIYKDEEEYWPSGYIKYTYHYSMPGSWESIAKYDEKGNMIYSLSRNVYGEPTVILHRERTYEYDNAGNVICYHENTYDSAGNIISTKTYDKNGNVIG